MLRLDRIEKACENLSDAKVLYQFIDQSFHNTYFIIRADRSPLAVECWWFSDVDDMMWMKATEEAKILAGGGEPNDGDILNAILKHAEKIC